MGEGAGGCLWGAGGLNIPFRDQNSHKALDQGCRNGRFGKRSFCPVPKTGGFDENWRKF